MGLYIVISDSRFSVGENPKTTTDPNETNKTCILTILLPNFDSPVFQPGGLKSINMRSYDPHLVYLLDIFTFICGFEILNEKFEFPSEWIRKNKTEPVPQYFFPIYFS